MMTRELQRTEAPDQVYPWIVEALRDAAALPLRVAESLAAGAVAILTGSLLPQPSSPMVVAVAWTDEVVEVRVGAQDRPRDILLYRRPVAA